MANCKNHPQTPAAGRCAGCAEEFCKNCLVDIQGQKYCGACKVMALQGKTPTAALEYQSNQVGFMPNTLARDSLIISIVSIFCCGIILGPIAISKALKAKEAIKSDPRLGGAGMATAGMIIGIISTILFVIGLGIRLLAVAAR